VGARALLGLWIAAGLLGPRTNAAEEPGPEHAMLSALATESLLLDAERAGSRIVAVGEWGHVVLSDDEGASWRQARWVPTRMTLTAAYFVDAQLGWAVGHDSVILHTDDGGESWEMQYSQPEAESPLLGVWFENADHGLVVGAFGLALETKDGGHSWTKRRLTESPDEDFHLNALFAGAHGAVFVAAEFGSVFRSLDGGVSWQRLVLPYEGSFWGGLGLEEGPVLVFGMRGHVFRSEDRGDSWSEIETGTDQSLQMAARLRSGRIVVVGLGGVILGSSDAGKSFVAVTQPDRSALGAVIEGRPGQLLLFGEKGITRPVAP
jgi:photosystem II stability/assembly factor-like uncharacterized protein